MIRGEGDMRIIFLGSLWLCAGAGLLGCSVRPGASGETPEAVSPPPVEVKRTVDYLLSRQREDGSWPGLLGSKADFPGSIATSALVCMSLLECQKTDPERIRPVLEKGIRSCLEQAKGVSPRSHWSYIWSQTYSLRLLARLMRHPSWSGEAQAWRPAAAELVKKVIDDQRKSGAWGYGQHGTSFQTAEALLALWEIREAGVEVPGDAVDRGVSCLQGLRAEHGYLYAPGLEKSWASLSETQALDHACARVGLCEGVLYRYDKVAREDLNAALQAFVDHRGYLWEAVAQETLQQRFISAHGSPYFFWVYYAYYHAVPFLPEIAVEKRREWSKLLLADLLTQREADGTWRYRLAGEAKQYDAGEGNTLFCSAVVLLALNVLEER
jgi:hypothetical protein